jgi:hypothetical protein
MKEVPRKLPLFFCVSFCQRICLPLSPYFYYVFLSVTVPPGRWMADRILEVDKINPQNAASLSSCFSTFRRYDQPRQQVDPYRVFCVDIQSCVPVSVNHTC